MTRVQAESSRRAAGAPALVDPRASSHRDAARWDEFVARCPDATFFHRIGWRAIIEEVFRHRTHYLLAERGGAIVGVLPLAEVKSLLFGHALRLAAVLRLRRRRRRRRGGGAVRCVDAAVALGARAAASSTWSCAIAVAAAADWPRQDLYVTFRKAIVADVEANLLAIPRKQRAMVRKGIKNGLRSEIDAGVDRFFALYADNVHRHGTPPCPRRYFEACAQTFGDDCEVLTVVDAARRAGFAAC